MTDQGLLGDVFWIGYTISLIVLIITSFYLARYEKLENKSIRDGFVFVGAFLGILSFFLVF